MLDSVSSVDNEFTELLNKIKQEADLYQGNYTKKSTDNLNEIKEISNSEINLEEPINIPTENKKYFLNDDVEILPNKGYIPLYKYERIEDEKTKPEITSKEKSQKTIQDKDKEVIHNNDATNKLFKRTYSTESLYVTKNYLSNQNYMFMNNFKLINTHYPHKKILFILSILIFVVAILIFFSTYVKQSLGNLIQQQTNYLYQIELSQNANIDSKKINTSGKKEIIELKKYTKNETSTIDNLIKKDLKWFESQPKLYYTIQLAVIKNKKSLFNFKQ